MDMKTSPLALLKDPSLFKTDALINGQWVKGSNRFDIHDPATGAQLADMANMGRTDRTVFYRFKWLDNVGNQVGDGESWKQMSVLGLGQQIVKSVAPTSAAVDLRLEMNVEPR
jgi:uncharacterized protein YcfL